MLILVIVMVSSAVLLMDISSAQDFDFSAFTAPGMPNLFNFACVTRPNGGTNRDVIFLLDGRDVQELGGSLLVNIDGTFNFLLTRELEGVYSCTSATREGVSNEKTLVVTPTDFNQDPVNPTSFFAEAGQTATLQCSIPPGRLKERYSVIWQNGSDGVVFGEVDNSFQFSTHSDRYSINHENFALQISDVQESDSRLDYRCILIVRITSSFQRLYEMTATRNIRLIVNREMIVVITNVAMSTSEVVEELTTLPPSSSSGNSINIWAATLPVQILPFLILLVIALVIIKRKLMACKRNADDDAVYETIGPHYVEISSFAKRNANLRDIPNSAIIHAGVDNRNSKSNVKSHHLDLVAIAAQPEYQKLNHSRTNLNGNNFLTMQDFNNDYQQINLTAETNDEQLSQNPEVSHVENSTTVRQQSSQDSDCNTTTCSNPEETQIETTGQTFDEKTQTKTDATALYERVQYNKHLLKMVATLSSGDESTQQNSDTSTLPLAESNSASATTYERVQYSEQLLKMVSTGNKSAHQNSTDAGTLPQAESNGATTATYERVKYDEGVLKLVSSLLSAKKCAMAQTPDAEDSLQDTETEADGNSCYERVQYDEALLRRLAALPSTGVAESNSDTTGGDTHYERVQYDESLLRMLAALPGSGSNPNNHYERVQYSEALLRMITALSSKQQTYPTPEATDAREETTEPVNSFLRAGHYEKSEI